MADRQAGRGQEEIAAGAGEPLVSVVVPAHNEEKLLPRCLQSIDLARQCAGFGVETIVVLNRCTDDTERIAREFGAGILTEDARNLARIRNAGARAARGSLLVTIDADSRMSPGLLAEVAAQLRDARVIGGGTDIRPERSSAGIRCAFAFLELAQFVTRLSAGAFWCRREDFVAIGGFDERLNYAEDVDFASRLRRLGRQRGQRYKRLRESFIITSCRKFDRFGDWHPFRMMFTHPWKMWRELRGRETRLIDEYYYDFNDGPKTGGLRDRRG